MKKVVLILAAVTLICLGLSSCKTTGDCPAYSKAPNSNIEKRA